VGDAGMARLGPAALAAVDSPGCPYRDNPEAAGKGTETKPAPTGPNKPVGAIVGRVRLPSLRG